MKLLKKLTSFILVIMMIAFVMPIANVSISAATDDVATDAFYYLVGNFDGVDVGVDVGDEDSANQGYAMVDGQVTVTVKGVAYVCVKNNDSLWYMTDGWLGSDTTTATLYRADDTSIERFDKLYVPKGTYTFTVTENSDGTVTLSYAPATNVPPVPAEGYSLIGQFDGVMVGDGEDYASSGYAMDGGKVTLTIESVAYVCVKDNYQLWYMTDGWVGYNTTTATLYSVDNTSIAQFDKLYVPAGTYTFTLLQNSDGTVTLSYAEADSNPTDETTTVAEPTTAEPTTAEPTTAEPTTAEPTTAEPTTAEPTTVEPTTVEPTTVEPTTAEPTTIEPTTAEPTETPTVKPTQPTTKAPVLKLKATKLAAGKTTTASVSNKNGNKVTFTSSKPSIAKVNKNTGKITALRKGTTYIRTKVGTKTLKIKLTVSSNPVLKKGSKTVKNNAAYTIKKNGKLVLKANGKATAIKTKVTNSKKNVAKTTISKAKITIKGLKTGTTILKIKLNGVKTYKVKIKVK